jgi:WD40 repeat protein
LLIARLGTSEPGRVWEGTAGELSALTCSPNGQLLLTGTQLGMCSFHDARTLEPTATFDWGIGPIHSVAFSPDGLTCAAGGENGQVVVWDVDS